MEKKIKEKKPIYKRVLPLLLILVLIGGIIFGIKELIYYAHYENTDDAQVDGDISPVVARVGGYVKAIRFKDNEYVKKGDTLVILDDQDYRIQLEKAKAALAAAQSSVGVSTSNVNTAEAHVPPAQSNVAAAEAQLWKVNQTFNRYKNLLDGQAITQAQFDAVKAEKDAAEAQLAAAKKQVAALGEQVASSKKQVQATASQIAVQQSAVDFAQLQLSYTVITAPVSGTVSRRNIQIGQLVNQGQQMFAVVNDSSIYVTANFKETQLTHMQPGQPVEIDIDAFPDHQFHGHVASFSGATGAKFSLLPPNNATGNYVKVVQRVPVRIDFDSLAADWKRRLVPGMSVEAIVQIKK